MTRNLLGSAATLLVLPTLAVAVAIGPAQIAVLDRYVTAAKAEPGYAGPSTERGRASHAGGKPDTPACTSCHTVNLTGPGQTRAGKPIDPGPVSRADALHRRGDRREVVQA